MAGWIAVIAGSGAILLAAGCEDGAACKIVGTGTTAVLRCPDGSQTPVGGLGGGDLLRLDPEPPGANCPQGGVAIHAGADTDGDGVLSDAEITSTEYVCNGTGVGLTGTLAGDYTIASAADAAAIAGVTRITGSLSVTAPSLAALSLPLLARVDGDLLFFASPQLAAFDLPALLSVGGALQVGQCDALVSLAGLAALKKVEGYLTIADDAALASLGGLGALGSVGGTLEIRNAPALTSLDGLGALRSVAGTLIFDGLPALARIDALGALTSVDSIEIGTCPALASLAGLEGLTSAPHGLGLADDGALVDLAGLDALTVAGGLHVSGCGKLTSLHGLEALTSAGAIELTDDAQLASIAALGALGSADGLFLDHLPVLTSLAGLEHLTTLAADAAVTFDPQLTSLAGLAGLTTARGLLVQGDDALTTLGLGALTTLTDSLTITDNALLRQCLADALLAQLGAAPGSVSFSGNDGAGTCP